MPKHISQTGARGLAIDQSGFKPSFKVVRPASKSIFKSKWESARY